jgi:uncharacterized protein YuzE
MEATVAELDKVDVLYDKQRDILYINFGSPREADESELFENDILVRYSSGKVIGLSVLSFSKRSESPTS